MAVAGSLTYDTKIDSSGFKSGLDKVSKLGTTAFKGVSVAITAVTTALVAGTTAIINYGSEFETSLTKVSTLFGNVRVDTENLTDKVLELSTATGISATELNEGLYQALSAGVDITEDMSEATEFLATATKLAKGGFTSVETAVDATTSVLNAYGMETKDVNKFAEILIKTQNAGKTTVEELGASISQVTPTASAMNVEFEQIGASLAIMTAKGVPTAQATTQLNSLLAELGKSGTKANTALMETYEGTDLAIKSFQDLMAEGIPLSIVLEDMGKYAGDSNLTLLDMFSSIEAGKSALTISQDGEEFISTLSDMRIGAGQLDDAYEKMADTFETQSARAKEGVKNLGISIYTGIQPYLKDTLKEVNGWIGQLSTAFEKDGVKGLTKALGSVLGEMISFIVEKLPDFFEMAIEIIESLVDGLEDNLDVIVDAVLDIFTMLVETFFELLPQLIEMGVQIIIQLALGLAQAIPDLIPVIVDAILTIVDTLLDNLDLLIDAGIELILALAIGLIEAIPDLVAKIPEIIVSVVGAILNALPKIIEVGVKLVFALIKGLWDTRNALLSVVWDLMLKIPEKMGELWCKMKDVGKNLIKGLWEGITSMTKWIKYKIKGFTDGILDGIKDFFGINSPSTLMRDEIGKFIPAGIAFGIDANTDSAIKSIDEMNNRIYDQMSNAVNLSKSNLAISGTAGDVTSLITASNEQVINLNEILLLDGDKVYDNQQTVKTKRQLQTGFGG
jgi:TP901 family phage tail tape measure protein